MFASVIRPCAAALVASLLVYLAPSGGLYAAQDETEGAAPIILAQLAQDGAETCLECHDDAQTAAILRTPHAQMADERTPFAKDQCETCHGPGAEHIASAGRTPLAVRFGRGSTTPAAEQNAVCLTCHQGGARINWQMSKHEGNDVPCGECHSVHAVKDRMLIKTEQTEVCVTCHRDQRAKLFRRSRHPVREGIISCSDCHNPHGSFGTEMLAKDSVNETCFTCHQEKRGPFLWEHQPVTERCTICHDPHGSVQPKLLVARAPQLCQRCHMAGFHPSTLYSGNDVAPIGANSRIIANGCVNCHPKVHGTNHPAGSVLTR